MNSLKSNTMNEIQKLFLKKKTYVFLIITAVISFLSAFFISNIQAKLIFISISSVSFPLIILSVFTNIFLPLFIFMAAGELFPGETADKTLKLTLTMPISRLKVYISKIIAIVVFIILSLLVIFLVSTVSALCLGVGVASVPQIFLSYIIDAIPALILAIFAVFIVQFFRNTSAALISCILAFIGIRVIALLNTSLNNNMFTSYLNWSSLWLTGGASFFRNINIFLLLLAYGIIFFTLGYYIFDKKEV